MAKQDNKLFTVAGTATNPDGTTKVRFANEGESVMHGHPEVPSPLPAGSRFWIAIEENGVTQTGSVAIDG